MNFRQEVVDVAAAILTHQEWCLFNGRMRGMSFKQIAIYMGYLELELYRLNAHIHKRIHEELCSLDDS